MVGDAPTPTAFRGVPKAHPLAVGQGKFGRPRSSNLKTYFKSQPGSRTHLTQIENNLSTKYTRGFPSSKRYIWRRQRMEESRFSLFLFTIMGC